MKKKTIKKILSVIFTVMIVFSFAVPAFADTVYENSIGSVAEDISNSTKVGKDTTQGVESEYQTVSDFIESETAKAYPCDVYATVAEGTDYYDPSNPDADENGMVDGEILVMAPKKAILGPTATEGVYSCTYKVAVKGNIAGNTVISVVPDSSFTMSQVGKDDITVNVTQEIQRFVVAGSTLEGTDVVKGVTPEFNDVAVALGTMTTINPSAGSWHGVCNFAMSMTHIAP